MHKELVLKGQTVNSEFYRTVIDRLMKRVQCSKAQFGNRFLLMIMLLPTTQLSSIRVSQRKTLLLLTTILTRHIWHLQTTFSSLN
jgi:hypothetical protein